MRIMDLLRHVKGVVDNKALEHGGNLAPGGGGTKASSTGGTEAPGGAGMKVSSWKHRLIALFDASHTLR